MLHTLHPCARQSEEPGSSARVPPVQNWSRHWRISSYGTSSGVAFGRCNGVRQLQHICKCSAESLKVGHVRGPVSAASMAILTLGCSKLWSHRQETFRGERPAVSVGADTDQCSTIVTNDCRPLLLANVCDKIQAHAHWARAKEQRGLSDKGGADPRESCGVAPRRVCGKVGMPFKAMCSPRLLWIQCLDCSAGLSV